MDFSKPVKYKAGKNLNDIAPINGIMIKNAILLKILH